MTVAHTLHDLQWIEMNSPACREQLYAALDRLGLERSDLGRTNLSPPSTRSTNICQDGYHERCPYGSHPTGWRGPFRCHCLCHQATNADAGRVPA